MVFSIYLVYCKPSPQLILEHFITPSAITNTQCLVLPDLSPIPTSPKQLLTYFLSLDLPLLDISWNHCSFREGRHWAKSCPQTSPSLRSHPPWALSSALPGLRAADSPSLLPPWKGGKKWSVSQWYLGEGVGWWVLGKEKKKSYREGERWDLGWRE